MVVTLVHLAVMSYHHGNVNVATVVKVTRKRKMAARRVVQNHVILASIGVGNGIGVPTVAPVETDPLNREINVMRTAGNAA